MDDHRTPERVCRVVAAKDGFLGRQGLTNTVGVSRDTVGSRHIHMQVVTMPPGARAKAHKHEGHETALYALSGTSHVWHGDGLEQHSIVAPGSFVYIPADVPHLPYNPSMTETAVVIVARTDPSEQESVVLLPHLEVKAA